jgi:hypothetical protein
MDHSRPPARRRDSSRRGPEFMNSPPRPPEPALPQRPYGDLPVQLVSAELWQNEWLDTSGDREQYLEGHSPCASRNAIHALAALRASTIADHLADECGRAA